MRLTHHVLLALASAAASSPLSEWTSLCIHSQAGQVQELVACSDASLFAGCLNEVSAARLAYEDVESCLAAAGCAGEMAAVGAETLVYECESVQEWSGDLRRRQHVAEPQAARTTEATPQKTGDVLQPRITARADEDDDKAKTTSKTGRPSDSDCYDTETTTTTACSIEHNKNVCDTIDVEKKTCRKGYLCVVEEQGGVSCMVRVDSLDIGGIIVSIVFGAFIVIALGLMTFFCCKDRREQKKLAAKAEAAAIAKASNVGKKARKMSDRQPLMAPGPSSPGAAPYGGEQPNPFGDQSRY